ncbi:Suppressor of Sensor Kinase (SLN1), partial [Spiromyces aspiralis]
MNAHARAAKQEREKKVRELNSYREYMAKKYNHMGRVLEVTAHPEDQTLRQLAQSKSNISIRWEMGHYLGGGAFGHVYQGRNLDTAELMAVKEIRFPELGAPATEQESKDIVARKRRNPKEIARLRNLGRSLIEEMEVMSRLSHPNIVTYYGIEVRRDRVYLFMEYCEAGSLSKLLAESEALTEKVVQWYVVQILRGLKYLHQLGIVHRDIKPENILLHSNDMIKLVDFGAAKMLNMRALSFSKPHRNSKYSRQNTLTGTPAYMAPETIKNDPSDRGRLGSQDIWALGCCIFELITSEPPWSDMDNEWAIMFRIANESPPLPTNGDLSDIGMDFLKKCFTRPASLRPTAEELLKHPWLNNATRDLERFEERLSHHHHSVGAQDGTGSFMSEDHPSTPGSSSKRQEAGFPFPSISSTATGSSSHQPGSAAARALNDEHRRLGSSGRHTEPRTLSIGSDADMSDSSLSRIRYSRMPLGQPPDHGSSRGMVTGNSCASTINSETTSNPPPSHLPTLSDASIQSPTASTVAGVQNPLAPDMHSDNPQSISVIESLLHLASQNDDHESGSQQHKYQAPSTIGTTLRVTINELFSEGIKKLGLEDLQASSTDRDGVVGPTSDSDNTAKRRQLQTECGAGASVAGEKETEEEGEETLPEVLEKYFREKVDYIVSSYLSIPIESTYGGETIHSGSVTTQMQVFSENEIRAAAETLYACFVQRYRQYRYYQRLLLRYQQQMRDAGQEITACNPSDVLQFESMHMPAHLGGARGHDQPVVQQEDSKTVPLVTVSGPGVPTTEPRAVAYDVVSMLSNSLSTTVEEEGEEGDVDDDEPTALGASADEDEGNINPFSDAEEVGDIGTFTGTAALLKDNDASIDRDQGSPDSGDDCSIGEIVKGRSASVSRSSSMRISRVRTSQEALQEMARYKLELEPPAIEPMFSTDVTPASTPYHDTPDHHSTDDVNSGSGGGGEAGFPFDPP